MWEGRKRGREEGRNEGRKIRLDGCMHASMRGEDQDGQWAVEASRRRLGLDWAGRGTLEWPEHQVCPMEDPSLRSQDSVLASNTWPSETIDSVSLFL